VAHLAAQEAAQPRPIMFTVVKVRPVQVAARHHLPRPVVDQHLPLPLTAVERARQPPEQPVWPAAPGLQQVQSKR
jgi:hypothetical protein